uniref:Uncharacterized protein n=1 Tax=Aegilops tauschii subsp. strangulata TaxID=200361 RepID=A0A453KP22_AEGTS
MTRSAGRARPSAWIHLPACARVRRFTRSNSILADVPLPPSARPSQPAPSAFAPYYTAAATSAPPHPTPRSRSLLGSLGQ